MVHEDDAFFFTHEVQGWNYYFVKKKKIIQGLNLETKIDSQKNLSIARKITCHRLKKFWVLRSVLVNFQRGFMKHVIAIPLIWQLLLVLLCF